MKVHDKRTTRNGVSFEMIVLGNLLLSEDAKFGRGLKDFATS